MEMTKSKRLRLPVFHQETDNNNPVNPMAKARLTPECSRKHTEPKTFHSIFKALTVRRHHARAAAVFAVTLIAAMCIGLLCSFATVQEITTPQPAAEPVPVSLPQRVTPRTVRLPESGYINPVPDYSYVTTRYMQNGHRGIDICAPQGADIYASHSGTVLFAGQGEGSYWSYGLYVRIADAENGEIYSLYAHMNDVTVEAGQQVRKGDLIGHVGSTGNSFGTHCHLEVYENGVLRNPEDFLVSDAFPR